MENYRKVGCFRLLDVQIINNGEIIFEGNVDDAPDEIKQLDYIQTEMGAPLKLYV